MPSYNKTILMGHLTRDPELRSAGASEVAGFGLAVNRRYKNRDGEQQEEVTFVDIECWGRTAELVAQYLQKGSAAHIEGRLKLDQWEDQDGSRRSKLKVVAQSVQFLPRSNESQPPRKEEPKQSNGTAPSLDDDYEAPF